MSLVGNSENWTSRDREWWPKDFFISVFTTFAGSSCLQPGRFTLKSAVGDSVLETLQQ